MNIVTQQCQGYGLLIIYIFSTVVLQGAMSPLLSD